MTKIDKIKEKIKGIKGGVKGSKDKRQIKGEIEREVDVGLSDGDLGFLVLIVAISVYGDGVRYIRFH